jgi:signal transduction histidine kinase
VPSKSQRVYLLEKPSAFALALLVSFVVILGAASIIAYNSHIKSIQDTIHLNTTRANLLTKLILEHQRAAIGILRSYANRPLVVDSVKTKNFEGILEHLRDLTKNNPEMIWPFISNPDSTIWANFPVDRQVMNKDLSERDWYKGVSREWKPYVSSVYKMIVGEQDLAIAVSTPIFDEKGKVIGILGTAQSAAFFQKIIREIGADLNMRISLIDKDGNIISSNRFPYKKEISAYPSLAFVSRALKGEKGDVEIRDAYDGNEIKFVSFEPVEGIGWSIIVEKGKREVIQSELIYLIQLGIISFLIWMIFAFSLWYLRQKHKQVAALRESAERLQQLASQLITAQENERKRIARELHDSIGSFLVAIKLQIETAIFQLEQGAATPDSLKKVIPTVQQTIEESRRIQMNLRPSILDDLGILPTLEWQCREFEKTCSHIRIEKRIEVTEDQVPDSLKTVIYRISQEGLNNIVKHSKANLVILSLQKNGDAIELAIRDNGQGFEVEKTLLKESRKRGLGLSSMKERTEFAGGSFAIESNNGAGTVIRARWPVE